MQKNRRRLCQATPFPVDAMPPFSQGSTAELPSAAAYMSQKKELYAQKYGTAHIHSTRGPLFTTGVKCPHVLEGNLRKPVAILDAHALRNEPKRPSTIAHSTSFVAHR